MCLQSTLKALAKTTVFVRSYCTYNMFTLLFLGSDTIDYSRYPNKEYQLEWLRMYLKEVAKIKGNPL